MEKNEDGDEGGQEGGVRTIHALSTQLSHHIHTSTVIISGAGAIRQLLDNAVDALATNIEITTVEYGSDTLRVSDNGSGIAESNFNALCKPHSTSKMTSHNDLLALSTLGFRGEALNSLCALSDVVITTRTSDAPVAHALHYDHNGHIERRTSCPREPGTTVEVSNLFCSLPVRRREFERTAKKDFARIMSVVQEFALLRPDIRFNFFSVLKNGKRNHVLSTGGGSTKFADVVTNLFGACSARNTLIKVETCQPEEMNVEECGVLFAEEVEKMRQVTITGFVSSPEHGEGRSSSDRQFIFVNGRPVDYPRVCRLVNEMYSKYNRRQYPVIVLKLDMPPPWVDVNVTPDKRVVFCQQEKVLCVSVRAALSHAFTPFQGLVSSIEGTRIKGEPLSESFDSGRGKVNGKKRGLESVGGESGENEKEEEGRPSTSLEESVDENAPIVGSTLADLSSVTLPLRRVNTVLPEGFKSRLICQPTTKRAKTSATEGGMKSLLNFAFKVIPHQPSTSCALDKEKEPLENDRIDDSTKGNESEAVDERIPYPTSAIIQRASDERGPGGYLKSELMSQLSERSTQERRQEEAFWSERSEEREEGQGRVKMSDSMLLQLAETTETAEEDTHSPPSEWMPSSSNHAVKAEVHSQNTQCQRDEGSEGAETDNLQQPHRMEHVMDVTVEQIRAMRVECEGDVDRGEREEIDEFPALFTPEDEGDAEKQLKKTLRKQDFLDMEMVGQFNDGFIITRLHSHLFIVDQHASDEKFNFERLQKSAVVKGQQMMRGQSLDVGAVQEMIVRDNESIFTSSGFRFHFPQDGTGVQLIAVPMLHGTTFDRSDVDEVIAALSANPGVMYRPEKLRKIFASKACRSSVMIGTRLEKEKQEKLVRQLATLDHPWSCPHGRPTLRHLVHLREHGEELQAHEK